VPASNSREIIHGLVVFMRAILREPREFDSLGAPWTSRRCCINTATC
jgi:hypothetical protein